MSLKSKSQQVLEILKSGGFEISGKWLDLSGDFKFCADNSKTYRPDDFDSLLHSHSCKRYKTIVEVTEETTQVAAKRLSSEGAEDPVLLNFASAWNPGGGFINGAKAQEEDLARCSSLYPCLIKQMEYYEANRQHNSPLYTDHIIYSPKVVWFRTRSIDPPQKPFYASVITAPAPNARQARMKGESIRTLELALRRRAQMILGVAKAHHHRVVLLGAWGCGVFGNDPFAVAEAFRDALKSSHFNGVFEKVVFAIHDRSKDQAVLNAFKETFDSQSIQLQKTAN